MRILFWVAIFYLIYRWFYKGSVLEAALRQQRQRPNQKQAPQKNTSDHQPSYEDEGEYVDFEEVD